MKNLDKSRKYAYLNGLSTPQLENILRADMDSSGDGDIDMLLYIMELVEQREGGKSPENAADTERAKEEFDRIYNTPEGAGQSLYATEDTDKPETVSVDSAHKSVALTHGFRRVRRVGLIAAITAVAMLGVMVIAQAAGVDVFGAIARWTDESFSLGTIRYKSGADVDFEHLSPENPDPAEYFSIQEALDAYGITEVAEPTWIPDGLVLGIPVVDRFSDGTFRFLSANYTDGSALLGIEIEYYETEPAGRFEKADAAVTCTVNDIEFFIFENGNTNIAFWTTDHYAYYLASNLEKPLLLQIANTAISPNKAAITKHTSIQEALDAYGITEVAAPTWIPKRYSFDGVNVACRPDDGSVWIVSGGYLNGKHALNIAIENYDDEPLGQIEKTDAPVETFIVNGISVYLLENINSNIATWATEHYWYYIDCIGEKDELRQIAISAIAPKILDADYEYASIQEALDACGITEVAAPTWVPEGYSFDGVDILYDPDGAFWLLSGGYLKENRAVNIEIEYYADKPHGQIEKNDAPVETFTINGITVYLLENNNNNAAVWATEHYAYYIGCGGDKDNVRKMAISAIENVK